MEGFLLVNKPEGIPTFKLVTHVRRLTNIKKVGFAGTLDPFASGLIIMGIGRQYTKLLDHFHNYPKHYRTTLVLGIETDTLDAYGTVTKTSQNDPNITTSNDHIATCLKQFIGKQEQIPPQFSAKKKDGIPHYKLARQGIQQTLKPSPIEIYTLTLCHVTTLTLPQITLEIACSKGTYIRSLVRDIAHHLNSTAYTKSLTRLQIGPYKLENALDLSQLTIDNIERMAFKEIQP